MNQHDQFEHMDAYNEKYMRKRYWGTFNNILDANFPKGNCKERGRAMVMLATMMMALEGRQIGLDGKPLIPSRIYSCPQCHNTLLEQNDPITGAKNGHLWACGSEECNAKGVVISLG